MFKFKILNLDKKERKITQNLNKINVLDNKSFSIKKLILKKINSLEEKIKKKDKIIKIINKEFHLVKNKLINKQIKILNILIYCIKICSHFHNKTLLLLINISLINPHTQL